MSKLVIVESPAKAKTIQKYLGPGYEVTASMGHVRDLPKSKLGVDVEHGFEPQYVQLENKKELIERLQRLAASSERVYLATDPDREGEAISWHLAQLLALSTEDQNRVTFNEITKSGVAGGMAAPRKIDLDLVDAQQARRILDRIVGYKLSPFLWKKVKHGLSAGRVQSVAVRILVDREREIRAFVPKEYWSLDARFAPRGGKQTFGAKLALCDGKKIEVENEEQAKSILAELEGADYSVQSIKKGVRRRQPTPPFITSTLQQEASRKLGFTSQRTMRAAQALYEGVDVEGLGATGLITYMRTDSLRISDEARAAGNDYIRKTYGEKYLPEHPRVFKTKSGAQDAHEAIRPSMPGLHPDQVRSALTPDQYKLYRLIWERFIASLMAACVQDTVSADIAAGRCIFRASGFVVRFDGFTVLYEEGRDEDEDRQEALPELHQGDALDLKELVPNQHFTQPPPRYTEATLIKTLEEKNIGRPSTYAPIISVVQQRDYVEREGKALKPTALGEVITELMETYFSNIVDVGFTANMEHELDDVEAGKIGWAQVLDGFYGGFAQTLTEAEQKMDGTRVKVPDVETDVVCENCGRKMVIKSGRFGKFLACPGYPECKNTKPLAQETPGECPLCGGKILQKKSKNGHKYFGCEHAPQCGFMTWDDPTAERCPSCGKTLFKKRGGVTHCLAEGCGFEKQTERRPRAKSAAGAAKPAAKKPAAKSAKSTKTGAGARRKTSGSPGGTGE